MAASDANITDDASPNTLVTKKYVDENFSQVEVGLIPNRNGIYTFNFKKRFKEAPNVVLGIQNFWHFQQENCKRS